MPKYVSGRLQDKHDIEANWNKAVNFIPMVAETIVYDIDDTHDKPRFKIGDGIRTVVELPFFESAAPGEGGGAGQVTENGGVIFNDENNKAIAANSMVSGTNTQAGGKAFEIIDIHYQASDNSLLLFLDNAEEKPELDALEAYISENNIDITTLDVTIIATQSSQNPARSWGNLDYCGKIMGIGNDDTSHSYLFHITNTFKEGQHPWASAEQPAQFIIPALSQFGTITIGVAANASGYDTKAIGAVANAEGYNNMAVGKYSHVDGRDNVAGGYSSHATGWNNKALGQASFVGGKNNTVRNTAHRSAAFGEGQDVKWEDNFYVGRYGNNTSPRPFAVGIGTSDSDRRNGLEVTREGMVLIGKAGSSAHHNSVPQMWQLDEKAPLKNPAFTGTPTAPTPEKNDSSTKIATTEFVKNALGDVDVDLTNYVTKTNLTTELSSYIKRNPWITQNDGTGKQYFGVILKNNNGELNGYGATGAKSVVNGTSCNTDGENAGAFGNWCNANFNNSFAFGNRAKTHNPNQFVVGTDNAPEDDMANPSLFAVGNGTANNAKSTAFNVRTDGSAEVKTMGTKDNSVATKKYVDDATVERVDFYASDYGSGSAVDGWFTITGLEKSGDSQFYWTVDFDDSFPSDTAWCMVDYDIGATVLNVGMRVYLKKDEGAPVYSTAYYLISMADKANIRDMEKIQEGMAAKEYLELEHEGIAGSSGDELGVWYTITSVNYGFPTSTISGVSKSGQGFSIGYMNLQTEIPIGAQYYNGGIYVDVAQKANKEYVDKYFVKKPYVDMRSLININYTGGAYMDYSGEYTIYKISNNIMYISTDYNDLKIEYTGIADINQYFHVGDIVNIETTCNIHPEAEGGILDRFEIKADLRHYVPITKYNELEARIAALEAQLNA